MKNKFNVKHINQEIVFYIVYFGEAKILNIAWKIRMAQCITAQNNLNWKMNHIETHINVTNVDKNCKISLILNIDRFVKNYFY